MTTYEEGHVIGTWTYALDLGDRSVALDEGVSTIGRSRSCTVTISDASASRTHAELEATNGTVKLRDLGSSNGTYVDGARVVGESPLRNGSLITIGETVMTVRLQPAPGIVEPLAPAEDVGATVRIEAIKRPPEPGPVAPPPAATAAPDFGSAPSLRPAPLPSPAAPSLGSPPAIDRAPIAAPALGGLPSAPRERPVSRTDVFSPLGSAPSVGPSAVEKTMLEVPQRAEGRARQGVDDMRPRESAPPPLPPPPPQREAPAGPRDILGSIDALDHTALGARAVRAPAPPPARPAGVPVGRPAGFWLRFGAVVVDGVVLGLPILALQFVLTFVLPVETARVFSGLIGIVAFLGLPVVGWAMWGRTPGKALLRIGVVAEGSNRPGIGFGKAVVRLVAYAPSLVLFVMAAVGDKRALHDRISGTRVIRL